MKKIFFIPLITILSCSFNSSKDTMPYKLPPNILIKKDNCIYNLSVDSVLLNYKDSKEFSVGRPYILNNGKNFTIDFYHKKIIEKYRDVGYVNFNSQLLLYDIEGKFIDTIIKTKNDEKVFDVSSSINDSLFAYTITDKDRNKNFFDYKPVSLVIYDLKNKTQLLEIEDICFGLGLRVSDRAWSSIGNKFIFSVNTGPKIEYHGTEQFPNGPYKYLKINEEGIYLIDMESGNNTYERILNKGYGACWHPSKELFAYIKEGDVWLYNYLTKEDKRFYKSEMYEDPTVITWSPDGKYLLINGRDNPNISRKPLEKLLSYPDGKTVEHEKMNIGYGPFSWK